MERNEFMLYRSPGARSMKIPYPAMQLSGLAGEEELRLRMGNGGVLVCRKVLSVRDSTELIAFLRHQADRLAESLVCASRAAAEELTEPPDPLDELNEDVVGDLLAGGADPDGLRMLMELEADHEG